MENKVMESTVTELVEPKKGLLDTVKEHKVGFGVGLLTTLGLGAAAAYYVLTKDSSSGNIVHVIDDVAEVVNEAAE